MHAQSIKLFHNKTADNRFGISTLSICTSHLFESDFEVHKNSKTAKHFSEPPDMKVYFFNYWRNLWYIKFENTCCKKEKQDYLWCDHALKKKSSYNNLSEYLTFYTVCHCPTFFWKLNFSGRSKFLLQGWGRGWKCL